MPDAPTTARPLDTHTHSDAPHEGGASSGRQAYDLGSATLSEVREAGKQTHTANLQPLEIHDGGLGNRVNAIGHGPNDHGGTAAGGGGDMTGVRPESSASAGMDSGPGASKDSAPAAAEATDSAKASTTADDLQKRMETARGEFGQADSDKGQAAAITKIEGIVADADRNSQSVKDSAARAAEALSPGIGAAVKDLDDATKKISDELQKTDPASTERIKGEMDKWSDADGQGRKAVEDGLRQAGNGGLADALGNVGEVQKKHAGTFAGGEAVEDKIQSSHGKGIQDAFKAQIDSRTDLQQAYLLSGRSADAARVSKEIEGLRGRAGNFSQVPD